MPMMTPEQYIESLSKLKPTVYIQGQKVENFIEHPLIRPAIQSTAEIYRVAQEPEHQHLATTISPLTGERINRFSHLAGSPDDLVQKVKFNRLLQQRTGTCFVRCIGLDYMNAAAMVTYDMDKKLGTDYHRRLIEHVKYMQRNDLAGQGGITDLKGDRSLRPAEQADPDLYLHVVERRSDGIIVRGAKAHQTGSLQCHEAMVSPCRDMRAADRDYAVAFAVPIDTPGLIHIVGRSTLDSRWLDGYDIGNIRCHKYTTMVVYDNVFVPWERVFMCGESEFAGPLVRAFAAFHRQSHGGCKAGRGDVIIGAASAIAEYNGVDKASHVQEKLTDMVHMAETLYACTIAASTEGTKTPSGVYFVNNLLANAAKLHEGRVLHEMCRLAQDIAGGLVGTMPSEKDWRNPEIGKFVEKYLRGVAEVPTEHRMRMIRLIEKLTLESADLVSDVHGGGSPAAHRMTILRETDLAAKRKLARVLAGIEER